MLHQSVFVSALVILKFSVQYSMCFKLNTIPILVNTAHR